MNRKAVQILLAMLLVIFTATAVAGKNNHARHYPKQFLGTMTGEAYGDTQNGACLSVTGAPWQTISNMTGWLTHLGQSEYFSTHCATQDASSLVNGEATLVAEDGDEVWLTYTAEMLDFSPPRVVYLVRNKVVGGTGRFEDAHGKILSIQVVTLGPTIQDPVGLMMTWSGKLKY